MSGTRSHPSLTCALPCLPCPPPPTHRCPAGVAQDNVQHVLSITNKVTSPDLAGTQVMGVRCCWYCELTLDPKP